MADDSTTAGYLTPKLAPAPVPLENDPFADFVQAVLVGLTGLGAASGVRPSWQPIPPPTPEPSVDWVGFAIGATPTELEPEEEQLDAGGMIQTQHEILEVLVSCYGPHGEAYAKQIRAGLHVEQNRDAMYSAGVGLVRVGRILHVPEKRNEIWYDRWDLTMTLSREERREFAQLHFLGAAGAVVVDRGEDSPAQEFTAGNVFIPSGP